MGLGDMMSRSAAAQGMMRGGAEEGMGMPPEELMGAEEAGAPPAMDLEGALAGVESAIEGEAPEKAEEIRVHLNAIREIVGAGGGEEAPPEAGLEELAAEVPPAEGGDVPPMPA